MQEAHRVNSQMLALDASPGRYCKPNMEQGFENESHELRTKFRLAVGDYIGFWGDLLKDIPQI